MGVLGTCSVQNMAALAHTALEFRKLYLVHNMEEFIITIILFCIKALWMCQIKSTKPVFEPTTNYLISCVAGCQAGGPLLLNRPIDTGLALISAGGGKLATILRFGADDEEERTLIKRPLRLQSVVTE